MNYDARREYVDSSVLKLISFSLLFFQDAETKPAQFGGGGSAYAPRKHGWLIATEPVPDTSRSHTR